jgi:hypothetical protein
LEANDFPALRVLLTFGDFTVHHFVLTRQVRPGKIELMTNKKVICSGFDLANA